MKIRLKLYATLRKYLPNSKLGEEITIELSPSSTVEDVIEKLGMDEEQAKIILVNGNHKDLGYKLKDNDLLVIFPPVGGG